MRQGVTACVVLMLLLACQQPRPADSQLEAMSAVYYWRTEFRLDSTERNFLKAHDIGTIYCRYFDVVQDEKLGPVPNAPLRLAAPVPEGVNWVPTVFVVEDCMRGQPDSLAVKIVQRIAQMNETNDILGVKEIQIDCDYTRRSRETYYQFLKVVAREADKQGWRLSVTIRLHQLSMPAPPADEGVLMLYNTGTLEKADERNPILDLRDVLPYVPYLKDYDLPLAAAYPVFLWQRRVHGVSIEHEADIDEVKRVKQTVEKERADLRRRIITYDLSEENINRYRTNDYETIYQH